MGRYRFLLRPGWLALHVLVLLLVLMMISLGFWQLRRLDEKKDRNALVEARQDEPVVPVEEVLPPDAGDAEVEALNFRRVEATGTYQVDEQVLVRNRSLSGSPGTWVLTPLLLDDGTALVVSRGWIPLDGDPERAAPPDGEVTVQGFVQMPQTRGTFGPTDAADGTIDSLSRVDVERLQQQVDETLLPAWIQLVEQDPAQPEEIPAEVPLPTLDEGPHLSYAGQWFIFAAIAAGGYVILLRRTAAKKEAETAVEDDRADEPTGPTGPVQPVDA
jgi:surfeit locus 1 family protein